MFTTGKAHFSVGAGIPLDWFWRARMVAAVERGGRRTGGRSAQGDGSVGTMASKMGGAERSNFTNWPKASLPCCQQVRKTLAKICCVRAAVAVRLPPQALRAIAMSRIARSAKLLVACNPGQRKKVNRCGCSCRKWLASRSLSGRRKCRSSMRSSWASNRPVATAKPCADRLPAGWRSRKRSPCCSSVLTAKGNWAAAEEATWIISRQRRIKVLQAALMKRPFKSIETSRSVMHQKTGVVLSPNRRRLRIPTMRLNHINSDLFAQQHPQILRTCAYSPAGVVQPYHGALPQLTLQLLVGGGC